MTRIFVVFTCGCMFDRLFMVMAKSSAYVMVLQVVVEVLK